MYAAASVFADYSGRKAANTLKAQRSDLDAFAVYLCVVTDQSNCPAMDQLQRDPAAWRGVTWGLVAGFMQWMLQAGYAIGSANRKLSTVRVYAKLASQAGAIDADDLARIRGVSGYGSTEGKRVDEKRREAGGKTRTSHKKAQHVTISAELAKRLKAQPDTPQGRRDAVIMTLFLDHGLRVGELALLQVTNFDRPKVDKVQTHRMTTDTLRAIAAWRHTDAPASGPLLRGSRKGGKLTGAGMIGRAITARVTVLGAAVGLMGLSAHDCRHYWATRAATMGTDGFALRDAGGWSSMAMPAKYVEAAAIANERVKL